MNRKRIQWPRAKFWDKCWNPIIGCKPCSPACENCYAAAWARRFGQSFEPHLTKQRPPRKGVVFCGNVTDLFGEWVHGLGIDPEEFIKRTGEMFSAPTATYLYLTKRVDRMCRALCDGGDPSYECIRDEGYMMRNYSLWNHYFGFTAENQEWYDRRIREACQMPSWANGWVSAEPLLGPLKLQLAEYPFSSKCNIKWIVVGCESGPKRRPCRIEWVEDIVEQCRSFQIPVFIKQLDINGHCVTDIDKFPGYLQFRQVPWAKEQQTSVTQP